jgi:uncharacterized membrane protein YcgQ (UPF0703/DUF1980 family)
MKIMEVLLRIHDGLKPSLSAYTVSVCENSVEFSRKKIRIEFWYNGYDHSLDALIILDSEKFDLVPLLAYMGIKHEFKYCPAITDEEVLADAISGYRILLDKANNYFLQDDLVLSKAVEQYRKESIERQQRRNDDEIALQIEKAISNKDYLRAITLFKSKQCITEKDQKKIRLLQQLADKETTRAIKGVKR